MCQFKKLNTGRCILQDHLKSSNLHNQIYKETSERFRFLNGTFHTVQSFEHFEEVIIKITFYFLFLVPIDLLADKVSSRDVDPSKNIKFGNGEHFNPLVR